MYGFSFEVFLSIFTKHLRFLNIMTLHNTMTWNCLSFILKNNLSEKNDQNLLGKTSFGVDED